MRDSRITVPLELLIRLSSTNPPLPSDFARLSVVIDQRATDVSYRSPGLLQNPTNQSYLINGSTMKCDRFIVFLCAFILASIAGVQCKSYTEYATRISVITDNSINETYFGKPKQLQIGYGLYD